MAEIVVFHWNLAERGGAEAICMHVLDTLQHDHNITLVTAATPDLDRLNEFYGTNVTAVTIQVPNLAGIGFERLLDPIESATSNKLGYFRPLRYILFQLAGRDLYRDADLVFNTYTEMSVDCPTIQYIHYPAFNRSQLPDDSIPDGPVFRGLDRIFNFLAGLDTGSNGSENNVMLTNSQWTADLITRIYGKTPRVVPPPINTAEFDQRMPLEERENGFLAVGRLSAGKNLLRSIEIIRRLRWRGHEVHFHIVGSPFTPGYDDQLREAATKYDFVTVEGAIPREELVRLLQTHRYGIHGKHNEHFGMVVAEMVAAGMLPFAPDSGGQQEILNYRTELLYSDADEAVRKIDKVLSNPELEKDLRESLPDVETQYDIDRFRNSIRSIVDKYLSL